MAGSAGDLDGEEGQALWLWHFVEGEQALDLEITSGPTITIDHVLHLGRHRRPPSWTLPVDPLGPRHC
jgi:hypothetical protein